MRGTIQWVRVRHEDVAAFAAGAEPLKAPIVHALGGKERVDSRHPSDVGMTDLWQRQTDLAASTLMR